MTILTIEGELHYVINQLEGSQIFANLASFLKWEEIENYDNEAIFFSKKEMGAYSIFRLNAKINQ